MRGRLVQLVGDVLQPGHDHQEGERPRRQTETTSSAQKRSRRSARTAVSSSRPSWSTSTWLTRPLSRWNMKLQVITARTPAARTGRGTGCAAAPRPRKAFCSEHRRGHADAPSDRPTDSTVKRDGDQERVQQRLPTGRRSRARPGSCPKPDERRLRPVADVELGQLQEAIPTPTTIGTVDQQLEDDAGQEQQVRAGRRLLEPAGRRPARARVRPRRRDRLRRTSADRAQPPRRGAPSARWPPRARP